MQYWSLVPWIKAESQDFNCIFIVSLQIKRAGIQSQNYEKQTDQSLYLKSLQNKHWVYVQLDCTAYQ